jgi:hypothetical protein
LDLSGSNPKEGRAWNHFSGFDVSAARSSPFISIGTGPNANKVQTLLYKHSRGKLSKLPIICPRRTVKILYPGTETSGRRLKKASLFTSSGTSDAVAKTASRIRDDTRRSRESVAAA